ncbi:unnamed protein product [Tilletia caries]|uniref:Uncharacterized protein n=1 Tax=Tilletia caries TaxID=13290 RepID=A0A177TVI7_9BASI|nr:hypothetical protein CF335_g5206 [Tilletia laevis]KAE8257343.1 hypothetical protein A4X03_0g4701 [Tilletia caries]CAD6887933.1 unnamed protein product [Tilletia caries]CAD6912088.1 unnamed protein product [Tilletia caries]CAD6953469.1 unnamed protein product [Tilletia caries]
MTTRFHSGSSAASASVRPSDPKRAWLAEERHEEDIAEDDPNVEDLERLSQHLESSQLSEDPRAAGEQEKEEAAGSGKEKEVAGKGKEKEAAQAEEDDESPLTPPKPEEKSTSQRKSRTLTKNTTDEWLALQQSAIIELGCAVLRHQNLLLKALAPSARAPSLPPSVQSTGFDWLERVLAVETPRDLFMVPATNKPSTTTAKTATAGPSMVAGRPTAAKPTTAGPSTATGTGSSTARSTTARSSTAGPSTATGRPLTGRGGRGRTSGGK